MHSNMQLQAFFFFFQSVLVDDVRVVSYRIRIRIIIRMSFIGQVCLHIRGICYSDKAPQCNRMTATGQDTDNKRTIIQIYK